MQPRKDEFGTVEGRLIKVNSAIGLIAIIVGLIDIAVTLWLR